MARRTIAWTAKRAQQAQAEATRVGIAAAAQVLSKEWAEPVTPDALSHALRRYGLTVAARRPSAPPPMPTIEGEASTKEGKGVFWKDYAPRPSFVPTKTVQTAAVKGRTLRGIIIPDAHVPSHDRKAWGAVTGIVKEWQPDFGVIIGDFGDFESLLWASKHMRARPDGAKLAEEYYSINIALDELQNPAPSCAWDFIEGNHEHRAVLAALHIGELEGLLNVPEQLFITARDEYHRRPTNLRGMRWVPYAAQPLIKGSSAYYHGHASQSKHHAVYHAEHYAPARCPGKTLFYGHNHTFQSATGPSCCVAQCVGFLGDPNAPSMQYKGPRPVPWATGLVLQEVDDQNDQMSYTVVQIQNGKAVFHGSRIPAHTF